MGTPREIVGDYVHHIRATRPHVVAGFVCGEGGGQHHQASTALTIEAVRDAADPAKYPEQIREGLRPWRVMRLFCTEGFGKPATPGPARPDGRDFDPLIGRTCAELGTEARSMHKCQGTSQLLPLPPAPPRVYKLLDGGSVAAGGLLDDVRWHRHVDDGAREARRRRFVHCRLCAAFRMQPSPPISPPVSGGFANCARG